MNRHPALRQKGVALIVVLFILAVMVSLAATMSERLFVQFQRAESQRDHQQAYWYAISVEALAKYAISESIEEGEPVNLNQEWAMEEQVYPLDYGEARGKIRDLQSCFNLNVFTVTQQLSEGETKPYLVSVMQMILEDAGIDSYQAEVIADSALEFMDKNDNTMTGFGVESATYEALKPAYLTANSIIADSSEMRAINQVDAKVMRQISSLFCALPTDEWRLNVNTIDKKGALILTALFSPYLSLSDAEALIENRPFDGWSTTSEFLAEAAISGISDTIKDKAKQYLSIDSSYFEMDVEVLVNESRVRIRSLLYSNGEDDVQVMRRRFGGISE